jgi:deoxyadenosine/deoxycytidine kinase
MPARRVEICGGIAAGKTTLCALLAHAGLSSYFECFKKNPFWALFYQNPDLHAFETEVTFLLQHYSQIKTSIAAPLIIAFDYSLLQDEAYAHVNLNGRRLKAFEAVYRYVVEELPPPALIVHLQCPAEEELRRVRSRARREETSIQLAYLDALNRAIAHAVGEVRARIPILQIDSAVLDFANDLETRKRVVADILAGTGSA